MHILLIFHHYRTLNERGGLRSFHIGSYLAKQGNDVTAIIPGIDPLTEKKYRGLKGKPYIKENIEGVTIFRVNSARNNRASKLSRVFYFLTSSIMQMLTALCTGKCDVILCSSLPCTLSLFSALLAKLRNVPLIIDVRDLPLDYAINTEYLEKDVFVRFVMKLESAIYEKADSIVTISKGLKKMVINKGVPKERVHFLPIGYDKYYYERSIDWRRPIKKEYGLEGKFIVLYAGSMGYVVDILTILRAAKLTVANEQIVYVFAGAGQRVEEYKYFAVRNSLNARFIGEVAKSEVILLCSCADVCVYALGAAPIYSTFLGNKVFDYFGAATPLIFCGPEGDISDIVSESEGGKWIPAEDFVGLAEMITDLYEHRESARQMGQKAKKYIESKYLTEDVMERLDKIVSKTIQTKG